MALGTFLANRNTWMDESSATTNFGGNTDFYVGEFDAGAQVARGLIGFDLTSFSSSTVINSGTLTIIDMGGNFSDNDRQMQVYRCLRNWVQNEASWNVYSTGNNWTTAGAAAAGDREQTSIGSVILPGTSVAGPVNIAINATSLQEWINGSLVNNGMVLKNDTETNDMHRFYSSSGGTVPFLVINYTDPLGGNLDLTSKMW